MALEMVWCLGWRFGCARSLLSVYHFSVIAIRGRRLSMIIYFVQLRCHIHINCIHNIETCRNKSLDALLLGFFFACPSRLPFRCSPLSSRPVAGSFHPFDERINAYLFIYYLMRARKNNCMHVARDAGQRKKGDVLVFFRIHMRAEWHSYSQFNIDGVER